MLNKQRVQAISQFMKSLIFNTPAQPVNRNKT